MSKLQLIKVNMVDIAKLDENLPEIYFNLKVGYITAANINLKTL